MCAKATCAFMILLGLTGILADTRTRQYELRADVAEPSFSSEKIYRKRDVSHVLGNSGQPSRTGSSAGSGSFASAGSYGSTGAGTGYSGSGTGSQPGYSGVGTSYNPTNGFQDYYTNNGAGYPYYPPQNSVSNFGPGFDFQNFLQQYFNSLQQQQQAIQAQLQAQQQAGGGYSWAGSGAYMTHPDGSIDPNAKTFSYSRSSPGIAMSSSAVDSGSGYGGFSSMSSAGNRFQEMSNRLGYGSAYTQHFPSASNFGSYGSSGGTPGYSGSSSGNPGYSGSSFGTGPHRAVASASLGPQGGHQAAEISPASPGIQSRFGESVPAPSGNTFGVFTSSSSGHAIGPDGKETSFKTATTGVNDNGKVSYHTVHDP